MSITERENVGWIHPTQDKDRRRVAASTTFGSPVPQKARNFLTV
jgi:hypothetical protein